MKIVRIITSLLLAVFAGAVFSVAFGTAPAATVATFASVNIGVNAIAAYTGWTVQGLAVDFSSLLWTHGNDNTPGVRTVGYFALKSWLTNFPEAKTGADLVLFDDYAKLEDTVGFTFSAGKGFLKAYGTEGKNKVDSESQGETDCKTFKNVYTFLYPGTTAEAKGWCRKMNNEDAVFIAVEADGTKVVIGHPYIRTMFNAQVTTGDERTSQKGVTVTVECTHELPAPIYEGTVTLHPNVSS